MLDIPLNVKRSWIDPIVHTEAFSESGKSDKLWVGISCAQGVLWEIGVVWPFWYVYCIFPASHKHRARLLNVYLSYEEQLGSKLKFRHRDNTWQKRWKDNIECSPE